MALDAGVRMGRRKKIALIAHDNKKADLVAWMRFNRELLAEHDLYATRTTGRLSRETLGLQVTGFHSGPLGGDQQIGAKIVAGECDFLIFFWDPLEPHPHDPDVRALLRIAAVWNVPVACNPRHGGFYDLVSADGGGVRAAYRALRRRAGRLPPAVRVLSLAHRHAAILNIGLMTA